MSRSRALDAYRGATIAGMILVNYAGPLPGAPALLRHAAWDGFTAADLVFPSFLFIVGVAIWLAFRPDHRLTRDRAAKIARRSALLFAIGLAINAFPFVGVDYATVTIMGVLQRIALCYGIAALLCLTLPARAVAAVAVAILVGYGALLAHDPELPARLDRALFGASHLNPDYTPPFDPEGVLATLPSLANVLAGYLAARWLGRPRVLALAGLPLVGIAIALDRLQAINKPLWTPAFALLTIGLALVLLAATIWIVDGRGLRAASLVAFGRRPLTIYVIATLVKGALVYLGALAWLHAQLAAAIGDTAAAVALATGFVVAFGALAFALARSRPRAT